jgi:hypothetical protein
VRLRDLGPDGDARHAEVGAAPVVALDEDAHGVAARGGGQDARGGADASLEPVADHAGAAPDVALRNGAARGAVERSKHVLRRDVEPVDVVERAVVGLGDHRKAPGLQAGA